MAASYQAKDSDVLGKQLKAQELVIKANDTLITDDATDLFVDIKEDVSQVLSCIKQVAAGTVSGVVATVHSDIKKIKLAGETGAASTTTYIIKYIAKEN